MFKQKPKTPKTVKAIVLAAITAIVVLLSIALFWARPTEVTAANNTINFQARLTNNSGSIVADGVYNVEFKIYNTLSSSGSSQGSCTGDAACLWAETRTGANRVTVANGYLTVDLGSVASFPSTIDWSQDLYLSMRVGGSDGTPSWDAEMSPRLHLTAVPYAFRAGVLVGGSGSNVTILDAGTPSGNNTIHLPAESGTLCIQGSGNCGFALSSGAASYIQNQNSADQTANFRISGTGQLGTSLLTPLVDTPTAAPLNIGTNNATVINLNTTVAVTGGKNLTVASGGKVGIGVSGTPDAELEVNGVISQKSNGVRNYTNLYSYAPAGTQTGTLKIVMPKSWSTTNLQMVLSGNNLDGNASWEVLVRGYNYSSGSWMYPYAEIRGDAPFSSVRLAHDGTNNVLLLGNTSTSWVYPQVTISSLTASMNNVDGWGSGWSASFITSETGITSIADTNAVRTAHLTSDGSFITSGPIVQNNSVFQSNLTGNHSVYQNLTSSVTGAASVTGAFVINTNIDKSDTGLWMNDVAFTVYDYSNNNQANYNLSFYKYGSTPYFYRYSYTRSGSLNLPVRLAHDSNNKVVIIVGDTASALSYPQLTVSRVITSSTSLAKFSGWTVSTGVTSFAPYTELTAISEKNVLAGLDIQGGSSADALTVSNGTSANAIAVFKDNNTSVMTIADGGAITLGPSVDSTSALQVRNAAGSSTIFNVDTVNGRVGIGGVAGYSKLEVIGGDAAVYNNGGNPRLILGDSTAAGENGYLQWDSTNNYFRIESVGTNGLKINDNYVSIGNIYPGQPFIVGNGSVKLFDITTNGDVTAKTTANSATAFRVQDASSNSVFNVNTSNGQVAMGGVTVGSSANAARLYAPWLSGDAATTVYAGSNNASNNMIALHGESYSNIGIQGSSATNIGVYGVSTNNFGVVGEGAVAGVLGTSAAGVGVQGESDTSYSAFFKSSSASNAAATLVVQRNSTSTANLVEVKNADASDNYLTVGAAGKLTVRTADAVALAVENGNGAMLFTVNNPATELAANGGAEASGTFGTNWTAAPAGGTITRTTTSDNYASGSAGVQVATSTTANTGVRNHLASNPATSTTYQVSFTGKASGSNFSTLSVLYSRDGGTTTSTCATNQTLVTTGWTKITCTFTTDGTPATNADLIIRKTDTTARTFYIDNLSVTVAAGSGGTPASVQIGGGDLGGQPTLFTLDRSAGAPVSGTNNAFIGSMYYDTSIGRIQCFESDGWGSCGSAPDNIIILTPEFAGATLNGTGIGTMTSDFCGNGGGLSINTSLCASGVARNFYKWTSPQGTSQTYSVYVSYKLPSTFKNFANDNTINLTARTDNTTTGSASYEVFRSTGAAITACGTETAVTSSANTWQTVAHNGSEFSSCGFAGGDTMIVKINMTSRSDANVYISELTFTYTNN